MEDDAYRRLAQHLDRLPGGFPPTEDGVELRILQRLFTPDEARLAVHCTLIPETAAVIARRAGISMEEASRRLEAMAQRGLLFNIRIEGRPTLYMAAQYVIGIWEYHVKDLDPDLIRDMNAYIPRLMDPEVWKKSPQLRTVPVGRSIPASASVLPYERAEELVRARKRFLVAPCICRTEHRMMGEGCDRPVETCLVFDLGADFYERNGLGRRIDLDEALDILKQADRAGLVLQPSNARKVINICCCCGCCCQVLKTLKRYPAPATLVSSPFIAALDPETCKGCGVCVDRCQMDALEMNEDKVCLDPKRCIGCGLCVSTCPTGSLTLSRKPDEEHSDIPGTMVESAIRLGRTRGKLGTLSLAKMQIRSKVDRLLAARRKA
jgi:Na+-translocating ferredoxin:NAD+ oxidoreductase subunit B